MNSVLHVGCGSESLPEFFPQPCVETRVDINPDCSPDIVADMSELPDGIGPFDAVYSCHCLEHLMPHRVDPCLRGFSKVLKQGGAVIVLVPDLGGLEPTEDILFISPGGEVRAADLFYGFRKYLEQHPYMAHRTGFVESTLRAALESAGFEKVQVKRLGEHNLFGVGVKA